MVSRLPICPARINVNGGSWESLGSESPILGNVLVCFPRSQKSDESASLYMYIIRIILYTHPCVQSNRFIIYTTLCKCN